MRKYMYDFFALSALVLFVASGKVCGQSEKNNMDEMMKIWKAAATPGEAHKKLDAMAGSWNIQAKMWMGPDAPPMESKGTAEFKWVLGNRFLMEEMKGEMMGMPMTGIGYNGYDNVNKKYTMFWLDNFGTAMSYAEGAADQSGKIFTMYGKMDEPTTGEHDKNVKYVTRIIDKDTWIFEMHDLAIGEPNTKVMELTYNRKK